MIGEAGYRIGIDLGGTKTEAVALAADGTEAARVRRPTPSGDYGGTVRLIAGLVAEVERRCGPARSVGVGIPGAISPATGRVKNANSTWLNGRNLMDDLAAALGRPVRIANDANCFALSEATDGAAAGAAVVFGVILGTGVGGGLVVDGRSVLGRNAIAGEWGHNPLPYTDAAERAGHPCWCGRDGCIEAFLAGPALERDYRTATGHALSAAEIAAAGEAGDEAARSMLDAHAGRLARALAGVINLIDPDVIVLGGGLSNLTALYRDVPARWGDWVFSDRVDTALLPPAHGDSSGVRGAARLWDADGA